MFDLELDHLKYVSYAINGLIGLNFIRRRILLDSYIEGLWEGYVADPDDLQFYLKCSLILARTRGTPCEGFVRYSTHHGKRLLASGVDRLVTYEGRQFPPRSLSATFVRDFHEDFVDGSRDTDDAVYVFQLSIPIAALAFIRELLIETKLQSGRTVRGRLHRRST